MEACVHMETCHKLASTQQWYTEGGESLLDIATEHLRRMYTSLAEDVSLPDVVTSESL